MEGGDILISCDIIITDKTITSNREITASWSGKRNRTKKQVERGRYGGQWMIDLTLRDIWTSRYSIAWKCSSVIETLIP